LGLWVGTFLKSKDFLKTTQNNDNLVAPPWRMKWQSTKNNDSVAPPGEWNGKIKILKVATPSECNGKIPNRYKSNLLWSPGEWNGS